VTWTIIYAAWSVAFTPAQLTTLQSARAPQNCELPWQECGGDQDLDPWRRNGRVPDARQVTAMIISQAGRIQHAEITAGVAAITGPNSAALVSPTQQSALLS